MLPPVHSAGADRCGQLARRPPVRLACCLWWRLVGRGVCAPPSPLRRLPALRTEQTDTTVPMCAGLSRLPSAIIPTQAFSRDILLRVLARHFSAPSLVTLQSGHSYGFSGAGRNRTCDLSPGFLGPPDALPLSYHPMTRGFRPAWPPAALQPRSEAMISTPPTWMGLFDLQPDRAAI